MTVRRPRFGIVGVWQETNTYARTPTTLSGFLDLELDTGPLILSRHRGTATVIGGFLECHDYEPVPILSAGAWPSGPMSSVEFRALIVRLRQATAEAGPVDGYLFNLHGAMVADREDDVEFAVVEAVCRDTGLPAAAVLDFHGNPSPQLCRRLDVLVPYNTYPHIDMAERGLEAANLLVASLANPRITVCAKVPVLSTPLRQGTGEQPMRRLIAAVKERGAVAGLDHVSILGGFPYSDVERAGMSVVAVAPRGLAEVAQTVVNEAAQEVLAAAAEFACNLPSPAEAVRQALAVEPALWPVVLVDVADNIGGGSPGDGTTLLAELLAQRATGAVVLLADAEFARRAHAAGPGGVIDGPLGARTDDLHGRPVRVQGTVRELHPGHFVTAGDYMTGAAVDLGPTALVRVEGVDLIVTSRAVPPFHPEQYGVVGIDPRHVRMLTAKGAVAWRTSIPEPGRVIYVDTPGVCPASVQRLPRRTTPMTHLPDPGWARTPE